MKSKINEYSINHYYMDIEELKRNKKKQRFDRYGPLPSK